MNFAVKQFNCSTLEKLICSPPHLHPEYEGNLHCVFLNDNMCALHDGRTGACRLFGIPDLSELGIMDLEVCSNRISVRGSFGADSIKSWLSRLVNIDSRLHPIGQSPYFVWGFNLSCWFDLYFDREIEFEPFSTIKNAMYKYLNLFPIVPGYNSQTGLKEKIDKISLFSAMIESADYNTLNGLLLSIRDDYPLTGDYFFKEANLFMEAIDKGTERL